MYVIVQHTIKDPKAAMERGQILVNNEGAPAGAKGLQFYPSKDGSAITCLWSASSVESIRGYVESVLGDASENVYYEVNSAHAFADRPEGLSKSPRAAG